MAKKLSGDSGTVIALFGLAVLYAVAVVVTAAAYLFPVVLIAAAVMAEAKARKQDGQSPALSDPERQLLLETEGQLKTIAGRLSEIEEEGAHLEKNTDGTYHRGSRLGCALNAELERLGPLAGRLAQDSTSLRLLPLQRLKWRIRADSVRSAYRVSVPVYFGGLIILFIAKLAGLAGVADFAGANALSRTPGIGSALYGSAFASAAVCMMVGVIVFFATACRLRAETAGIRESFEIFADAVGDGGRERIGGDGADEGFAEPDEPAPAWHEVLGVAPDCSDDEINSAWRARIAKNHPDRVAELDPAFRDLAETRTKQLNAAREEGLRQHHAG